MKAWSMPHNEEFVPQSKAPTLDEIFEAKAKDLLVCSENVKKAFAEKALHDALTQHVEQFNFGKLHLPAVRDAASEAFDFIEDGLFSLPYPVCIYRCTLDFGSGKCAGSTLLLVSARDATGPVPFAVVDFSRSVSGQVAGMHCHTDLKVKRFDDGAERALEVFIRNEEEKYWKEHIALPGGGEVNVNTLIDGAMLAVGLTMILNTKGIRKERAAPPAKPNKARAAKGRPLLPWVTRVYTDVYNKAIEPGVGTHASPRPHRRRAHVRRYPATNYREAYSIPIAAMLVNWDGNPLERGQYEVHHDDQ